MKIKILTTNSNHDFRIGFKRKNGRKRNNNRSLKKDKILR